MLCGSQLRSEPRAALTSLPSRARLDCLVQLVREERVVGGGWGAGGGGNADNADARLVTFGVIKARLHRLLHIKSILLVFRPF